MNGRPTLEATQRENGHVIDNMPDGAARPEVA
jgi:hypothetical protein